MLTYKERKGSLQRHQQELGLKLPVRVWNHLYNYFIRQNHSDPFNFSIDDLLSIRQSSHPAREVTTNCPCCGHVRGVKIISGLTGYEFLLKEPNFGKSSLASLATELIRHKIIC